MTNAPTGMNRIAAYWDTLKPSPHRARWWNWSPIIRHLNRKICGVETSEWNGGLLHELNRLYPGRVFERAVSIGCGSGGKEMALMKAGVVHNFDLFEVSLARIELGRAAYDAAGLGGRVSWRTDNGIAALQATPRAYDLVFWDNSLHHMPDTSLAIASSATALRAGGVFFMNDFVGRNRFQWSDAELKYGTAVRMGLSDRFFASPWQVGRQLPRCVARPTVAQMIDTDPSEAADSEGILPAIECNFPDARIWHLGGSIYHLCLNDVLANFDETHDLDLLRSLLVLDDMMTEMGDYHYAACLAVRN